MVRILQYRERSREWQCLHFIILQWQWLERRLWKYYTFFFTHFRGVLNKCRSVYQCTGLYKGGRPALHQCTSRACKLSPLSGYCPLCRSLNNSWITNNRKVQQTEEKKLNQLSPCRAKRRTKIPFQNACQEGKCRKFSDQNFIGKHLVKQEICCLL